MSELFRIKPLAWKRSTANRKGQPWFTAANRYQVYRLPDVGWSFIVESYTPAKRCESLEAGKAACQAHHEARMREHLEPVQADPRDTERLDWLNAHGDYWSQNGSGRDDMWHELRYNDACGKSEGASIREVIDAAMGVKP